MTERQLQFRVGLLVLVSMCICVALVMQFGNVHKYWEETYQVGIHFDEAPGMQQGTPVRQSGISIGSVSDVLLDDVDGGVLRRRAEVGHGVRADGKHRVGIGE